MNLHSILTLGIAACTPHEADDVPIGVQVGMLYSELFVGVIITLYSDVAAISSPHVFRCSFCCCALAAVPLYPLLISDSLV